MFKVKSRETNNIYTVCGCQEIRGVIYLLIYNGTYWVWTEAERFEPYDEPQSTPCVPYIPYPYPYITWSNEALYVTGSNEEPKDNSL